MGFAAKYGVSCDGRRLRIDLDFSFEPGKTESTPDYCGFYQDAMRLSIEPLSDGVLLMDRAVTGPDGGVFEITDHGCLGSGKACWTLEMKWCVERSKRIPPRLLRYDGARDMVQRHGMHRCVNEVAPRATATYSFHCSTEWDVQQQQQAAGEATAFRIAGCQRLHEVCVRTAQDTFRVMHDAAWRMEI